MEAVQVTISFRRVLKRQVRRRLRRRITRRKNRRKSKGNATKQPTREATRGKRVDATVSKRTVDDLRASFCVELMKKLTLLVVIVVCVLGAVAQSPRSK